MRRRSHSRGLTLLEVLVSIAILALIGSLIYGAFDGMARARNGISRIGDRYHQGRGAIARMSRELQTSFLSLHQPPSQAQIVRITSFVGKNGGTSDRLDFASFSHRRLTRNAHESDQNELGYFLSRDPDHSDKLDLVRREARDLDLEPTKGGVINVLAEDVESFDLMYLDPLSGEWQQDWDTTQASDRPNLLPLQVKITLVMRGGVGDAPIKLQTKVPLAMQSALSFGITTPARPVKGQVR